MMAMDIYKRKVAALRTMCGNLSGRRRKCVLACLAVAYALLAALAVASLLGTAGENNKTDNNKEVKLWKQRTGKE